MANKFPLVVDSVIKELATGDNLDLTGSGIANLSTLALSGELSAASLDISGNVDVDGVLETDGLSINGTVVTSTAAQLNAIGALSSTTSSAAELNLLDGVTGLVQADFTKLAAVTATAAQLNVLASVTATAAQLNVLASVTATAAELNYLDIAALGTTAASKAVTANASGVVNFGAAIQEQAVVVTSGTTVTVNLNLGSVFTLTLGHNIGTFNITNPAGSGDASSFILKLTQDGTAGRTITWPSSVKWAAATAPTLSTAATNIDVLVFFTTDGGNTYYGFTAGQVLS